jgi:hypothetical protein
MSFKEILAPIAQRYGLPLTEDPRTKHLWASFGPTRLQIGFHEGVLHFVLWNPAQNGKPAYRVSLRAVDNPQEHTRKELEAAFIDYLGRIEKQRAYSAFHEACDAILARIVEEIKFERLIPF